LQKTVLPKDEILKTTATPLLQRRGGRDLEEYRRRHPSIGADGVVRNIFDHPVCASKDASRHFLDAQFPLLQRRGIAAFFTAPRASEAEMVKA
jgi:hypothetical protein